MQTNIKYRNLEMSLKTNIIIESITTKAYVVIMQE